VTWTIHSWSAATGTGAVRSAHFESLPFGAVENPYATDDFVVGEAVLVEVALGPTGPSVQSVIAARQRQPAGTARADLDAINALDNPDMRLEARSPTTLTLWLGDCWEWCPPSTPVRFREVTQVGGPDGARDLAPPGFRLATAEEQAAAGLEVPEGADAFCIVTGHGLGRDGPSFYVVARSVEVVAVPLRARR